MQYIFKRYEKKYLIDYAKYTEFLRRISDKTVEDKYGESDVCNIYFDTPDFRVIRASIAKPVYKEKLRLRCYGVPDNKSPAFLELKKKYKGVVYKRRILSAYNEGYDYLTGFDDKIKPSQIKSEIEYFRKINQNLAPSMNIFYKRRAFYGKDDKNLRFTFDTDLLYRNCDLNLKNGIYGDRIIPEGLYIMEIKTAGAIPLWVCEILTDMQIYPTSFSKYGMAYLKNTGKTK